MDACHPVKVKVGDRDPHSRQNSIGKREVLVSRLLAPEYPDISLKTGIEKIPYLLE